MVLIDVWDQPAIDALDELDFRIRVDNVENPFGDRELGCLALAWERPPSQQVSKEKFALSREPVPDAIAWWAITGLPNLIGAIRYLLPGEMFLLWSHRSDLPVSGPQILFRPHRERNKTKSRLAEEPAGNVGESAIMCGAVAGCDDR